MSCNLTNTVGSNLPFGSDGLVPGKPLLRTRSADAELLNHHLKGMVLLPKRENRRLYFLDRFGGQRFHLILAQIIC